MATLSVSAYYYSQKEKETILQHLTPIAETESYIFGAIDVSKIAALKEQRILLDLHQDPSKKDEGLPRGLGKQQIGTRSIQPTFKMGSAEREPIKTSFYAIRLIGPLLDDWKTELLNKKVELRELIGNHIYKVKTENPAVFAEMNFISTYRSFGAEDKDVVLQRSVSSDLDPFADPSMVTGFFDIRMHKDVDVSEFVNILKANNITVKEYHRWKIRVWLSNSDQLLWISQQEGVYGIEEFIKPILHNDIARKLLHLDVDEEMDYLLDLTLTGKDEIVGVADTGIDKEHPDLIDNILKTTAWGRKNDTSDPNGHGTHVSGSIAGSGIASDGKIKGIAPQASLFFQSLLDKEGGIGGIPHDLYLLFKEAYDAGVRIHNNSWGSSTESEYRFNSLEVDEFVYNQKDMLLVISAGNEGTSFRPRNSNPGYVDWLSIGSPATAKNGLTVGASRSSRTKGGFSTLTHGMAWPNDYPEEPMKGALISGDAEAIAGFSSRGPCGNESRIKPDVVAPGTDIASTKSSIAPSNNFWGPYPKNRNYTFMGGTSMAAPIVSGFAALIREYLRTERNYSTPSAALLKAIIVNSTRELGGSDAMADHDFIPNFHQGFGCIDMHNIIPSLQKKELHLHYLDPWQEEDLQFMATGQRFLFRMHVEEGTPLRLCLCWTDPPGNGIQNNLNIMLMHVKSEHKWVGNERLPRMITSFDRDNNIEIIRIDDPHGGEYKVAVQANNLLVARQDFAMVITGNIKNGLEQIK